jgi:hypothetical protein
METKELKEIRRKIRNVRKEMSKIGPVMRGTVVVIGTKNKQPYFSLNKDKRTHLIYLGKKKEALAREYSENYKKLLELIEEMTILNMTILRKI